MSNILITGATGNVGLEVIRYLYQTETPNQVIAAVRDIKKAQKTFKQYPMLKFVYFDFEKPETFNVALKDIDRIFLLRPPHIANIDKYFRPLISEIKQRGIHEIVFLSVQGAEKSKVIPHNKIEQLIIEFDLDYIFIRPSYFMQNLTSTLLKDIQNKREIILPAAKAKFNWIDINNIAEVTALMLKNFEENKNRKFEITGEENENFEKVTNKINNVIDSPIKYRNVNPLRFSKIKKKRWNEKRDANRNDATSFSTAFAKGSKHYKYL